MDISINKLSGISFNAKFVNRTNLKEMCVNKFEDIPASIVEFDSNNENDIKAVNYIIKNWHNAFYIGDLYSTAMNRVKGLLKDSRIFFITKQTENFEHIKPEQITCYMNVFQKSKNVAYIDKLERKADYKGKGSGTGLINTLKILYDYIYLHSRDDESVKKFYEDNDFILENIYTNQYVWNKSNKRILEN